MSKQTLVAVFLSLLMFSGCFGGGDSPSEDEKQIDPMPYQLNASWGLESTTGGLGELISLKILLDTQGEGTYTTEASITRSGNSISPSEWDLTEKSSQITIVLLPNLPGAYQIEVTITPSEGDVITMTNSVQVLIPDEGSTSIIVPQYMVADSSILILSLIHI